MEDSTVNSQITDAVTQVNTKASGDAPATAMGNLSQSSAQDLNDAAVNAAHAQQQGNMIMQASILIGVQSIYSIGPEMTSAGSAEVLDALNKQAPDNAPE